MENEFIEFSSMEDYINSWRLAATQDNTDSLDQVLQYLNLLEFRDFDYAKLEAANSTAYINSYFAYEKSEKDIEGVIAKIVVAKKYLELMVLGVQNLGEIFFESQKESFVITDKLRNYISHARARYAFESPDDKRLLKNHASNYIQTFSKVRDFLNKKGDEILGRTAVVLSVQIDRNSY